MPTPDPSNILFTIAHPDLYERNPFNVLNLPVNATARDIRRRKEDIEAAFDAGTESDEFAGILPTDVGRKPPTRAEVADLFAALENPERRIAWALFWFWETPANNAMETREPNILLTSNQKFTIDVINRWWKDTRFGQGLSQAIGLHNVAIVYHIAALLGNDYIVFKNNILTSERRDQIWRQAIQHWNSVTQNNECWHYLVEYTNALNDPRADYTTVRSLRDQFAFAFDQINVELAIDYAKKGREADAKRQVTYMTLSQPGTDDVEGTFDDAFAGLLKQTETVVDATLAETKANPKDGLKQANAILSQTSEPLRVSRIVLEKGSTVRDAIVSAVFAGVRGCLIAYGNETKDWNECLKLTEKLKGIAETEEQQKLLTNDIVVISKNLEDYAVNFGCCVCHNMVTNTENNQNFVPVPLHKDIMPTKDGTSVKYSKITLNVPICTQCRSQRLCTSPISPSFSRIPEVLVHPCVLSAISKGWRIGEEPSSAAVSDCLEPFVQRKRAEQWQTFKDELRASRGLYFR